VAAVEVLGDHVVVAGEEGLTDRGLGEGRHADDGHHRDVPEERCYERGDGDAGHAANGQIDEQRGKPEQPDAGAEQARREVACEKPRGVNVPEDRLAGSRT